MIKDKIFKNKETALYNKDRTHVKYSELATFSLGSTGLKGMTLDEMDYLRDLKIFFLENKDKKSVKLDEMQTQFLKHCVSQTKWITDSEMEMDELREFGRYIKAL